MFKFLEDWKLALIAALVVALAVSVGLSWLTGKFKDGTIDSLKVSVAAYKEGAELNKAAFDKAVADRSLSERLMKASKDEAVARAASLAAQFERSKHEKDDAPSPRMVSDFNWLRDFMARNGQGR